MRFEMGILSIFSKKNIQDREFTPENIVGKKCTVLEKIDNLSGCGQVRINNQGWSARAAVDGDVFEVGEVVSVLAVEGVRLICIKN